MSWRLVKFRVDQVDVGQVNQTKQIAEIKPSQMPYQPVEVLKVQPQAFPSGLHDCNHGVDFTFDFIVRQVSSLLEDTRKRLSVVHILGCRSRLHKVILHWLVGSTFARFMGYPHGRFVMPWSSTPLVRFTILQKLVCL